MLKSITLEIGDKTIELTGEEARKLYWALENLFGSKEPIPNPQPWYVPPIQPLVAPVPPQDRVIRWQEWTETSNSSKWFLTESDIT